MCRVLSQKLDPCVESWFANGEWIGLKNEESVRRMKILAIVIFALSAIAFGFGVAGLIAQIFPHSSWGFWNEISWIGGAALLVSAEILNCFSTSITEVALRKESEKYTARILELDRMPIHNPSERILTGVMAFRTSGQFNTLSERYSDETKALYRQLLEEMR